MGLRPLHLETVQTHAVVTSTTGDGQEVRASLTVHFSAPRDATRARAAADRVVELMRPAIERAPFVELIGTEAALAASTLARARRMDAAIVRLELGSLHPTAALASSIRRRPQPTLKIPCAPTPIGSSVDRQPPAPTDRPTAPPDRGAAIVAPLVRQAAGQLGARVGAMLLDRGDPRIERVQAELQTFTAFALYDELVKSGFPPRAAALCLEAVAAQALSSGLLGIARYLHPVHAAPELELLGHLAAICDVEGAADMILALVALHRGELRVAAGFARGLARAT
jgi:hypothetical protein